MVRAILFVCAVTLGGMPAQTQSAQSLGRAINDPYTGERWLLAANTVHPERPRKLTLVSSGGRATSEDLESGFKQSQPLPFGIRAGQRVEVFGETEKISFLLEACALASAPAGGEFIARLKIGGRLVRARALASGRAEFVGEAGGGQ